MKNKKLIATVASLCLVLVAVVAAVIGVLAAATQAGSAQFQVSYTAKNVYATVTLAGKAKLDANYRAGGENDALSKTFKAQDTESTNTVLKYNDAIALGEVTAASESTKGQVNTFAVYRFSFKNEVAAASTSTYKYLDVTLNYVAAANSTVVTKWFVGNSDEYTFTVTYTDAGTTSASSIVAGALEDKTINELPFDSQTHNGTVANNLAPQASVWAYLVVAIADVNNDASYAISSNGTTLNFTLEASNNA